MYAAGPIGSRFVIPRTFPPGVEEAAQVSNGAVDHQASKRPAGGHARPLSTRGNPPEILKFAWSTSITMIETKREAVHGVGRGVTRFQGENAT
jgi:hypothetical protein